MVIMGAVEESTPFTEGIGDVTEDHTVPEVQGEGHTVSVFYIISFIIGLVGVAGNSLVLLVIYHNRKHKSRLQNIFVINQTIVDLVSSIFLCMTYAYKMSPFHEMWGVSGLVLCICFEGEGLLWIFLSVSAFSLMALTFERYMKIVFPILHHTSVTTQKKTVLIASTWLFPVIWLLAFILASTIVKEGRCMFQSSWSSEALSYFYGWTYIILFYFIPLLYFIYSYGHMLRSLHKRNSQVTTVNEAYFQHGPQTSIASRAQVNIMKTMLIVSCCFAVLWAPAQLYYFSYIIGAYTGMSYMSSTYYIFNIICFTNSVINLFIYVIKLNDFRHMLVKMLRGNNRVTS